MQVGAKPSKKGPLLIEVFAGCGLEVLNLDPIPALRAFVNKEQGEVTQMLLEFRRGSREAQDRLIPLVYRELRRIARAHMRRESATHSLQATALVHEAYLRLVDITQVEWRDRAHFFSVASMLMRRILVEHSRANRARKRGGGENTLWLDEALIPSPSRAPEIVAVDDALNKLAQFDERQAKIVEMRFFAGMTEEEIGDVLGISVRTVKRDWRIAKAWLFNELRC
jgi:RNA polymerase sigma factor (TIGR02999 family)